MALSHRFGIIQSLGLTRDEDDICEEYHLLQKLIGKNTIFSRPANLPLVSERGDNKDKSDSEDEKIDPRWRVEFRNIMRKCKQRKNKVCIEDLFSGGASNGRKNNVEGKNFGESCRGVLRQKCLPDDNIQNNEKYMNDADKSVKQTLSEKFTELCKNDENRLTDAIPGLSERNEINHNEECNSALSSNKSSPAIEGIKDKEVVNDHLRYETENQLKDYVHENVGKIDAPKKQKIVEHTSLLLTNNDDQRNQQVSVESCKENIQSSETKQLPKQSNLPKEKIKPETVAIKDALPKSTSSSAKTNKKVKTKPVINVIPSTSFPLDELLPQIPSGESKSKTSSYPSETTHKNPNDASVSSHSEISERNSRDTFDSRDFNIYNYHHEPFMSTVQEDDNVFHGEVFDSPEAVDYDSETQESSNIDNTFTNTGQAGYADSYEPVEPRRWNDGARKGGSLGNFSFVIDALQDGNESFVQKVQNTLSQQNNSQANQPTNTDSNNGYSNVDSYSNGGFEGHSVSQFEDFNDDGGDSGRTSQTTVDISENQDSSRPSRKDGRDNQSKKLFNLFVGQVSQLVRTNEDKKTLASLVNLLKKESGDDFSGASGFTPPATPKRQNSTSHDEVGPVGTARDKPSDEAENELFEGRTLLKGGVHPRHIPKTSQVTVRTGNDRPKDPRPVSTMLAKPAPMSLPLPKFIYELHDKSKIQRILTLDWDCKRTMYLHGDDNNDLHTDSDSVKSYNPVSDLQNLRGKSSDTKTVPKESPRIETNNVVNERLGPCSSNETTPLKDEARHAREKVTSEKTESVYGQCNSSGTGNKTDNIQKFKNSLTNDNIVTTKADLLRDVVHEQTFESNEEEQLKPPQSEQIQAFSVGESSIYSATSSISLDLKYLNKTGSFLDSSERPSFSEMNIHKSPSDTNNNDLDIDNNFNVKHTGISTSESVIDNTSSHEVDAEATNFDENEIYSSSAPVVQSIPVHLSDASREGCGSPRGVYSSNIVVLNDNAGLEPQAVNNDTICESSEKSVEEQDTPNDSDVIVLSDDDDDDDNNSDNNSNVEYNLSKSSKKSTHKTSTGVLNDGKPTIISLKRTESRKRSVEQLHVVKVKESEQRDKYLGTKLDKREKRDSSHDARRRSDDRRSSLTERSSQDAKSRSDDKRYNHSERSSHSESSNRKRKITTGARMSFDFEDDEDSQSSFTGDGKRKRGDDRRGDDRDYNTKQPFSARPKHIRERRRHSSCSSVESLKDDDRRSRRSTSRNRERHKSTISSTRISSSARPSEETRPSSRLSNEARSSSSTSKRSTSKSSEKPRHSSSTSHSKSETSASTKESRKRHHTVHIDGHPSSEKRSRIETKTGDVSKRRHSDEHNIWHSSRRAEHTNTNITSRSSLLYDDILSPEYQMNFESENATARTEQSNTKPKYSNPKPQVSDNILSAENSIDKVSSDTCGTTRGPEHYAAQPQEFDGILSARMRQSTKGHEHCDPPPQEYEDILSPENTGLTDEVLSEEYRRLFGKKQATDGEQRKDTSIFSRILPDKHRAEDQHQDRQNAYCENLSSTASKTVDEILRNQKPSFANISPQQSSETEERSTAKQKSVFSRISAKKVNETNHANQEVQETGLPKILPEEERTIDDKDEKQKTVVHKILPEKVNKASLEDDLKFLQSYKQKVQKKEATASASCGDIKHEKVKKVNLDDDLKFLQTYKQKVQKKETTCSVNSAAMNTKKANKTKFEDDLKFLQKYKQVQKKETTASVTLGEIKHEKCLDFKQELEDRKFLQMCKKKKEEKAKQMFEQQMRATFKKK